MARDFLSDLTSSTIPATIEKQKSVPNGTVFLKVRKGRMDV